MLVLHLHLASLMSRRNKLEKFAQLLTFPNVYQNYDPKFPSLRHLDGQIVERQGQWSSWHFHNQAELVLELGCGGGEYCLALAAKYPGRNFIGLDIKGNRIWKGARKAIKANLTNVAFLRTRIEQIPLFFNPAEVSQIWITFPDPFPKKSKVNRRLTSPAFLKRYEQILAPGAILHLKTDNLQLYDFTLETLDAASKYELISSTEDLYSSPLPMEDLDIKTYYEVQHLDKGRAIKYIQFQFAG